MMSKQDRADLHIERMMIYMWEDTDSPEKETKFGDHSIVEVMTEAEAIEETRKYIRGSLGRSKHKYDEGRIIIHGIWDASEYAKKVSRLYKHSKLDDYMRGVIGHWKGKGDFHNIDPLIAKARILKELAKVGQPLPVAGLSRAQCQSAEDVLDAFASGHTTIAAELCARFGKTIWSGAVAAELKNTNLVIVTSYVQTVFTSFENDLRSFEQFREFEHVDTKDNDYEEKINTHLRNGKKVIAYLSMCLGSKRQKRINYLFGKRANRLVLIDEADFGVHCAGQAGPLIKARKVQDKVIVMTGTNADRAVSEWPIDYYTGTTYPELVINKKSAKKYNTSLKYFKHNIERDKLVVDVEFYQMNLIEIANAANTDWFDEAEFPSWSKFGAAPILADGFFARMLESVFLGKHNHNSAKLRRQTGKADQMVGMMFLPGSMRNEALEEAAKIATQALPGYEVVPLSGYNKTTNKNSEARARDAIERAERNGNSVLFLSTNIAQRSFSVPQITDLFLAYDGGDQAATIQKMSRALTPGKLGKVGRIWSLSFDPNRDDTFDAVVLETAQNYQKTHNKSSLKDAMRDVLNTIDIFDCTNGGAVKIEIDEYLKQIHARKSISRVVGKIANFSLLRQEDIAALAKGNGEYFREARQEAAAKGKTRNKVPQKKKKGAPKPATDSQMKKARETVVTIVENMDIIILGTRSTCLDDAFAVIESDQEMRSDVEAEFGVSFDVIAFLFESGAINEGFVELIFDA